MLTVSTLLAFTLGTLLGGLLAWPRAPHFIQYLLPPLFMFSVVPYYLFGLILVYLLAFQLRIFPMSGSSQYGVVTSFSFGFIADVIYHSILPALSIILASLGFWALGMRAMMVSITGEDYMLLADAKGLKGRRIFLRYAMRNALLPQTTTLALSLAPTPGRTARRNCLQLRGYGCGVVQSSPAVSTTSPSTVWSSSSSLASRSRRSSWTSSTRFWIHASDTTRADRDLYGQIFALPAR